MDVRRVLQCYMRSSKSQGYGGWVQSANVNEMIISTWTREWGE